MSKRSGNRGKNLRGSRLGPMACVGLLLLAVQCGAPAWAQTNNSGAYEVGGLEVALPSPSSDLVEMGSIRTMMNVFVPDGNRLLAAFLLPDDLKVFAGGTRKGLRHYAMVEVPRRLESIDISQDEFQQISASTDKEFASSSDSPTADSLVQQGEDTVNQKLKALNSSHLTLEKPVMLGRFFSKTDAYAFGMLVPVTANGSTVNMLTGIVLLRVRNRILYGYLYTEYKGDETEPWMRAATEQWAAAIQSANAR